ncbi:phosphoribosyl 1,2-cyclic phosphodiesterase [Pseudomonas duriflava]|uniref:Phosphoribosyl 1,2-cyclic phosphodiesterase n=1 Tax=Pseudomonas duriflava TaxID=459528 RepID=A0A562QQZ6_9PSED|nr:MBL fold metallo-hydrolase [Pseudomonas duriflava]TWI58620.1 phosphoribosyl 1,2-cyclic phosphodiesterase [Pseudomonas duriflava]
MRFAVLGSGSRGNSTLVHSHNTYILIDCGFPLRETIRRLARLGVEPSQLDAILVTHEHSDHVHGVELLSRRYGIPVYLSEGTRRGLRKPIDAACILSAGDTLELGALEVKSVAVPHDANDPTQFVFFNGKRRLGVLTDLGEATLGVLECYRDLDALVIEANHDRRMLDAGPYPYFLKARVGGSHGHLNNQQAAALVARLECDALQHLVLAHLSEKNNRPHLARQTFVDTLGCDADWLQVADQHEGLEWQLIA